MKDSYETPINVDELLKRCLGEIGFVTEILNEFIESSAPGIEKLAKMTAPDSDREQLRVHAHRLRGTAATVSAEELSDKLKTIEEFAAKGQMEEVPQHVENVQVEFNRIREFVAGGIGASP